jgi:chromosome segregation ATPase
MFEKRSRLFAAVAATGVFLVASACVTDARAASRIVCWKDESGRVVGCGDRVPLEFQGGATKELDKHGITRKTTVTPEEAARQRAEKQELAKQQAEERKRLAEQQRQDRALLAIYASEHEIDERRDRELGQVEAQIQQLDVSLKNANERHRDLEARREVAEKDDRLAKSLPALQEELDRTGAEQRRLQARIAGREKDMQAIRSRFDEQKQRFRKLKSSEGTSSASGRTY